MNINRGLWFSLGWFTILVLAYYLISLTANCVGSFNYTKHRRLVDAWWEEHRVLAPSVDILLPVRGEPLEVLRNTWQYIAELVRAYPGLACVYVLDDMGDDAVKQMASEFGFCYGSRDDRPENKKSGNLRFGFRLSGERSNGKYIVVVDADFALRPDFLYETVPYLERDERLGIVQTPQFFRTLSGQNWLERAAGAVQELFYRRIQVSRQGHDGAICVGTNAVYRRKALAENGGGATLIEHSEDVHTGFDLRRLGWGLLYIPVNLATGNCPTQLEQFVQQQYRWCRGSMSLLGSQKFWREMWAKKRLTTLCCYLSGFLYYVCTALSVFMLPAFPLVLLVIFPEEVRLENYIWILPSIVYNLLVFPLWHRCRHGIIETMAVKLIYGWAHIFALMDALSGRKLGWTATGSKSSAGDWRVRNARLLIGAWGFLVGIPWVFLSLYYACDRGSWDFVPNALSGVFYLVVTAKAVGRTERVIGKVAQPRPVQASI